MRKEERKKEREEERKRGNVCLKRVFKKRGYQADIESRLISTILIFAIDTERSYAHYRGSYRSIEITDL